MIALISDTHFGSRNFNKATFETSMHFFENQFFPYLLENKIKNVIHAGDLVHNRNTIDLWILQELKTRFFKWFDDNDIKLHLIVGNHDLYYRTTNQYNFQKENLKEFYNCIIYDENTVIQINKYTIGIVPWLFDIKTYVPPKNVDIIIGHFEMINFPMMKNIISHDGLDHEIFKKYKYVFSGHYHTKSILENVYYIGTQYQLTWNDYDEDKGFYILKDNYKLKFISNTVCPKFVKIFYDNGKIKQTGLNQSEEITTEEAIAIAQENYVRIYTICCVEQYKLDQFHNSLSVVSKNDYKIEIIDLREVIEDYDFSGIDDQDENTIDIIINYIMNMTFEETISKDTLIDMSKILYREALDEAICSGDK